jgi:hypothetical protein
MDQINFEARCRQCGWRWASWVNTEEQAASARAEMEETIAEHEAGTDHLVTRIE